MSFKIDMTALLYIVFVVGGAISLIFGAISWFRTAELLLPLPTWVPATATLISPITVLTLIATRVLLPHLNRDTTSHHRWSTIPSVLNYVQTVVSTIVATVALAYLFPDRILSCNLDQQWQAFFQSKNSHAIRSIQDEFRCCGLRSLHDRAWPFKDRNHGDNACELQLGYQRSCFAPWKKQQQSTSWMIFAAAIFVFAAKVAFVQLYSHRKSWMSAQYTGRRPDYQRILHPEAQDEGDNVDRVPEETRRTFLSSLSPDNGNDWDVD